MSAWSATRLVAGRELHQAFRRKSFWVVVAVMFFGSTAAMVLPEVFSSNDKPTYKITVVGQLPAVVADLKSKSDALEGDLEFTTAPSERVARDRVKDGSSDIAVVAGDPPSVIALSAQHRSLVATMLQAINFANITQRLEASGLTSEQVQSAFATTGARLVEVDSQANDRGAAAAIVSIVLYVLLLALMVQVANGTAVEKSNRISEVLLAIVRPGALLFGKVVGVAVTGLLTLAAAVLPVVVKVALGGDLPVGLGGAILGGSAWFVLGLAFYLTLAGVLGALVERQEEAGSVIMPLTALLIGTFVIAQSAADQALGFVLAIIPFTSPLMEPTRIAKGVAGPVEMTISFLVLLASVIIVGRVGATLYGRAIVRTGRRLKLRDVMRTG